MEKYIPLDCLPDEYGGKSGTVPSIYGNISKYSIQRINNFLILEQTKKILSENEDFFEHQEEQTVDESKRPGKPKNVSDIFGVDGTFKKLDLF